ncbi:GIY-YIG nuclease family protein [Bacteroidota bacterium]
MAIVYILHSNSINRFYTGSCLDFDIRKAQHDENILPRSFTKRASDWEVFLKIGDLDYQQARNIEKHIKSMKSAIFIRNLKKYPDLLDRVIQQYK